MEIVLSYHAKKRLVERGIKMQEVIETIEFPDYNISKANKIEAHKRIENKKLKVVYTKDKYIKVITLIWK